MLPVAAVLPATAALPPGRSTAAARLFPRRRVRRCPPVSKLGGRRGFGGVAEDPAPPPGCVNHDVVVEADINLMSTLSKPSPADPRTEKRSHTTVCDSAPGCVRSLLSPAVRRERLPEKGAQ